MIVRPPNEYAFLPASGDQFPAYQRLAVPSVAVLQVGRRYWPDQPGVASPTCQSDLPAGQLPSAPSPVMTPQPITVQGGQLSGNTPVSPALSPEIAVWHRWVAAAPPLYRPKRLINPKTRPSCPAQDTATLEPASSFNYQKNRNRHKLASGRQSIAVAESPEEGAVRKLVPDSSGASASTSSGRGTRPAAQSQNKSYIRPAGWTESSPVRVSSVDPSTNRDVSGLQSRPVVGPTVPEGPWETKIDSGRVGYFEPNTRDQNRNVA